MLLRFAVKNYRSFAEEQVLLFTSSKLSDGGSDLIENSALSGQPVLPAILVWGANGSGKTNVIASLKSMASIIDHSHRSADATSTLPQRPFLLGDGWSDKPTEYELDFVTDGVRYSYGFWITKTKIEKEWLYAFPAGPRRKLFERKLGQYSFGRELKGRNAVISDLTRPNSLFLSCAVQNNHEQLTPIAKFFEGLMFELSTNLSGIDASFRLGREHGWNIDNKVIEFLKKCDTGIQSYKVIDDQRDDDTKNKAKQLLDAFGSAAKSVFGPEVEFPAEILENKEIEFAHAGEGGQEFFLPLANESAGTRRLLVSLPRMFEALAEGKFLAIDELDLSLHTKAAELVLSLFANKETNPFGAQLLATTHDTNLLSSALIRRDQIWFVEKSREGKSELYPLTDIATRKTDNIEKGYLQGRFGAVPLVNCG